jgi:hypothetical protein
MICEIICYVVFLCLTCLRNLLQNVAEYFLYIRLLHRAIVGLSYGRFTAIPYKPKLPTFIRGLRWRSG